MAKVKTKSGFQCTIDIERMKDYELVEALADLEDNSLVLPKIVKMILGKEQTENLKNHLRLENGVVPIEKLTDELKEILGSSQEIKN
ncbi:hypothetical protein ACFJYA_08690 [Enterococcus faecalis]